MEPHSSITSCLSSFSRAVRGVTYVYDPGASSSEPDWYLTLKGISGVGEQHIFQTLASLLLTDLSKLFHRTGLCQSHCNRRERRERPQSPIPDSCLRAKPYLGPIPPPFAVCTPYADVMVGWSSSREGAMCGLNRHASIGLRCRSQLRLTLR